MIESMVELEVDCFVVLPSVMYERLGRIQNGGIIVLLSAGPRVVSSNILVMSLLHHWQLDPHPKVSDIDQYIQSAWGAGCLACGAKPSPKPVGRAP